MLEERIREVFADMVVLKDPQRSEYFSNLSIPSYMRDWLVMKFSDDDGVNAAPNTHPGTISLSIRGINGELLLHRLDLMGIQVATGSACDSKENQLSHVIKALRIPMEYAVGTIRISFGKENEEADAIEIVRAIEKICKK